MTTSHPGFAHGTLHLNINTGDVSAAHDFYAGLLGLTVRMRTQDRTGDGTALGIEGATDTETWFLYDRRGPRVAPALELLQWNAPALARRRAPGPGQTGLLAVGYRTPDLAAVRGERVKLPYRGTARPGLRVSDPEGVVVELVEEAGDGGGGGGGGGGATMSHLRIGCLDLARSTAAYASLGFREVARAGLSEVSTVSLGLPQDPSFTLELVRWHEPVATEPTGAGNTQGLYRLALACEDVKAAHSALAAGSGWRVGEPVWIPLPGSPLDGLTVLFMRDPDDVVVELVERPLSALSSRR